MDKGIKISMLLEIYKDLLTDRQADIIDLYYNQNLSLSEIADDLGVTRQAIRKSLVEAEKNLFMLEDKLRILEKQMKREEKIEELLKIVNDEKAVKIINELR